MTPDQQALIAEFEEKNPKPKSESFPSALEWHNETLDWQAIKLGWLLAHSDSRMARDAGRFYAVLEMSAGALDDAKLMQRGFGDEAFIEKIDAIAAEKGK